MEESIFQIPNIHNFPDIPDNSKIIFPLEINYGIFKKSENFTFFQTVTSDSYFQLRNSFELENIHHFVYFFTSDSTFQSHSKY